MSAASDPSFRIAGEAGRRVAERVRSRLADRFERGVLDRDEVARITAERLHTFVGDEATSEFFRRCCVTWEVDRVPPIGSHRRVIGGLLVGLKTVVQRLLRFLTEKQLSRQRDFNWNLLLVLREILENRPHGSPTVGPRNSHEPPAH
jgi:hypothetical protein